MLEPDKLTGPMAGIVKQLDGVIAAAITARLGEGWILGNLKGRLHRITRANEEWGTFYLDGEPLFSVGPVRIAHVQVEDGYKFTLKQDFRHFNRTAVTVDGSQPK